MISALIFLISISLNFELTFVLDKEDKLYVWADSGLNFREHPSLDSKILKVLPKGTDLVYLSSPKRVVMSLNVFDNSLPRDTIVNSIKYSCNVYQQKGTWIKVKYQEMEGFVFSGFVSRYSTYDSEGGQNISKYVRKNYKELSREKKSLEFNDKSIEKTYFENGITEIITLDKAGNLKIIFPEMKLEEAVLLMRKEIESSFENIEICASTYQEIKEMQTRILSFTNQANWQLEIKEVSGTVIITRSVWC